MFLASYVFVKNPERVEVMGMIMGLCLLVYSIGQRMIRQELKKKTEMIKKPSKIKKQINQHYDGYFKNFKGYIIYV